MKLKPNITKQKRILKRNIAVVTPFLIMAGSGVIVNMLILKSRFEEMSFYSPHTSSLLIYFITLAMLTFLIYELNRKIKDSSVAIGLVLATVMSLPELIYQVNFTIPLVITIWIIINNYFSITLASYVFDMMWD